MAASVPGAEIEMPPMLMRNIDNLYLLQEPAGPTCLQLVSVVLQYNNLVQSIASQIVTKVPGEGAQLFGALKGHITMIDMVLNSTKKEVADVHDKK